MKLPDLIQYIEERQTKGFSGLPFRINAWKDQIGSINKGDYIGVASSEGQGKTKFCLNYFVFDQINFVNRYKGLKLRIDFFSLEESEKRMNLIVLSRLLYDSTGLEFSLRDFMNSTNEKKVLPHIKELSKAQSLMDTFEETCKIHTDCHTIEQINQRIKEATIVFPKREENYHLVIVDNLKFLEPSEGRNIKQTIDKLVIKDLLKWRNEQDIIPIIVQHMSASGTTAVYNFKNEILEESIKPKTVHLSDSTDTRTPLTLMIGLYSPWDYKIPMFPAKDGYDCTVWKDNLKYAILMKSRDGKAADVALHFKGNVGVFQEIPEPSYFNTPDKYSNYGLTAPGVKKKKWDTDLDLGLK